MIIVRLVGWRPGLQVVSLTLAIRDHSELDLAAAKAMVEDLLEGRAVQVECPDSVMAARLRRVAEGLGAITE